jgi:hypothetical protein
MTNIPKKTTSKNVQTHIEKAFVIINEWLPREYVAEVNAKMPTNKKPSRYTLHNVRQRKLIRIDVINAMVEVALEHKKHVEKLENLTA